MIAAEPNPLAACRRGWSWPCPTGRCF